LAASGNRALRYRQRIDRSESIMPEQLGSPGAEALEQCVDQIDEFVGTLQRYPGPVIAMALRIHLGALLHAMLVDRLCSRTDVSEFVAALEQEAVDGGGR